MMAGHHPQPFPKLADPQVALCHVETRTGIALALDGKRYRENDAAADWYLVFANADQATQYARRKVDEDPEVDCVVMNAEGELVGEIRPGWTTDPSRPAPVQQTTTRPWWKVWA